MAKKMKLGMIAMAILLITGLAGESVAFPVPATDHSQIAESAKVTINQVKEIKAQVDEIRKIGKEIANGGYAQGVEDLFGNEEKEGVLDRFGNSLKNVKSSMKRSEKKKKKDIEDAEEDKEDRTQDAAKETAKQDASAEQGKKEALQETKNIAKASRQAAEVENTYNFLKDNHSTGNSSDQSKDATSGDNGTNTKKKNSIFSNLFKSFTNKNKSNKDGSE